MAATSSTSADDAAIANKSHEDLERLVGRIQSSLFDDDFDDFVDELCKKVDAADADDAVVDGNNNDDDSGGGGDEKKNPAAKKKQISLIRKVLNYLINKSTDKLSMNDKLFRALLAKFDSNKNERNELIKQIAFATGSVDLFCEHKSDIKLKFGDLAKLGRKVHHLPEFAPLANECLMVMLIEDHPVSISNMMQYFMDLFHLPPEYMDLFLEECKRRDVFFDLTQRPGGVRLPFEATIVRLFEEKKNAKRRSGGGTTPEIEKPFDNYVYKVVKWVADSMDAGSNKDRVPISKLTDDVHHHGLNLGDIMSTILNSFWGNGNDTDDCTKLSEVCEILSTRIESKLVGYTKLKENKRSSAAAAAAGADGNEKARKKQKTTAAATADAEVVSADDAETKKAKRPRGGGGGGSASTKKAAASTTPVKKAATTAKVAAAAAASAPRRRNEDDEDRRRAEEEDNEEEEDDDDAPPPESPTYSEDD